MSLGRGCLKWDFDEKQDSDSQQFTTFRSRYSVLEGRKKAKLGCFWGIFDSFLYYQSLLPITSLQSSKEISQKANHSCTCPPESHIWGILKGPQVSQWPSLSLTHRDSNGPFLSSVFVCTNMLLCMWKPEVNVQCLSQLLSTLIYETGSLTESGALWLD